ncbi:hypothetical protein SALBM311S_10809 [Streptomyces alboniger]
MTARKVGLNETISAALAQWCKPQTGEGFRQGARAAAVRRSSRTALYAWAGE